LARNSRSIFVFVVCIGYFHFHNVARADTAAAPCQTTCLLMLCWRQQFYFTSGSTGERVISQVTGEVVGLFLQT